MARNRFKIEEIVHEDSRTAAEAFTCAVCMCLPEEPLQTACQHLFCAECIDPLLACPLCRADFGTKKGVPLRECNRIALSAFQALKVWCPYNEAAGGGFGGGSASKPKSTSSSGAAAASSSAYPANGMVAAASRGVGVGKSSAAAGPSRKRQRVEDVSSGEDGDFGQDAAPLCSWSGSYGDLLSGHLSECPLHIIKCPSGCGADIKRHDIEKHLRKVCKKSFEYCTICGEAVRPGMMQEHRSDNEGLHVTILEKKVQDQDELIKDLRSSDINTKIARLDQSITDLKNSAAGKATTAHVTSKSKEIMETIKSSRTEPIIAQVQWVVDVEELFKKCTKAGDQVDSDFFEAGGVSFFLTICPHGVREAHANVFVGVGCQGQASANAKVVLAVKEGPQSAFSPCKLEYDLDEFLGGVNGSGNPLGDADFISPASLKKAKKVQLDITFNAVKRVVRTMHFKSLD